MQNRTFHLQSNQTQLELEAKNAIPDQIWMLWCDEFGGWIDSLYDGPNGESHIACFSEEDADRVAEYQLSHHGRRCTPKRVK